MFGGSSSNNNRTTAATTHESKYFILHLGLPDMETAQVQMDVTQMETLLQKDQYKFVCAVRRERQRRTKSHTTMKATITTSPHPSYLTINGLSCYNGMATATRRKGLDNNDGSGASLGPNHHDHGMPDCWTTLLQKLQPYQGTNVIVCDATLPNEENSKITFDWNHLERFLLDMGWELFVVTSYRRLYEVHGWWWYISSCCRLGKATRHVTGNGLGIARSGNLRSLV